MLSYAEIKEYAELTTSMLQVEVTPSQLEAIMKFSIIEVYKSFFIETLFYEVPTTIASEFILPFTPLGIKSIEDKDGNEIFFREINSKSKIRRLSNSKFKILDNTIFPLTVEYHMIPDDLTTLEFPEHLLSVFTSHLTYKVYNLVASKDINLLTFYKNEYLEEKAEIITLGLDYKEDFRSDNFTAKGYV